MNCKTLTTLFSLSAVLVGTLTSAQGLSWETTNEGKEKAEITQGQGRRSGEGRQRQARELRGQQRVQFRGGNQQTRRPIQINQMRNRMQQRQGQQRMMQGRFGQGAQNSLRGVGTSRTQSRQRVLGQGMQQGRQRLRSRFAPPREMLRGNRTTQQRGMRDRFENQRKDVRKGRDGGR